MPRWRVDWPDEINRPLIKRLELNYWVQRHLIPPGKFPCTLTYITSSRILLSILEDSKPPEYCLSNLMCCCFASKVSSRNSIMALPQYIRAFVIQDTAPDYAIDSQLV